MTFRRIFVVAWLAACLFLAWMIRERIEERRSLARRTPGPSAPLVAAPAGGGSNRSFADQVESLQAALASSAVEILALLRERLIRPNAREDEAVLAFKTAEAYQAFLARAKAAGLTVLGALDELNVVRVGYDSLDALQAELMANTSEYSEVSANYLVTIPGIPAKDPRAATTEQPFGNRALDFLGVPNDHSQWGKGVTIAVLDSGVAGDDTLGAGRLHSLDIGMGSAPGSGAEDGHGTAVAGLIAGAASDAPGISPAATILSIRVTDEAGLSDLFTISQAIVSAVKNGATVVNISMGGYETNSALASAIAYATAKGAIVVASAGNDQAAQLTYPAADPRVISVGAVDALGQQVLFSNSGAQLGLMAPGYGVQTAWLNGTRILMDGTSASAPLVSGAIAAMLSENPSLTPLEAVQILQKYASDGGAPGTDPDYGSGVLNLGWAINRNNPTYIDTAIATHYFDAETGTMQFVVQNRGGQAVSGMNMAVGVNGTISTFNLNTMNPGTSTVLKVQVSPSTLQAGAPIVFTTILANPAGTNDKIPGNNRRVSTLTPPPAN